MTTIGVLALQGDFVEHQSVLRRLGVHVRQVRTPEGLRGLDGLVIPGGESTTFCRLMQDYNMYDPLRAAIKAGVPVWGTCAGLILMARRAPDLPFPTLGALDITARRNAYGRQVDSFEADISIEALNGARSATDPRQPFHGVFIRAPIVEEVGAGVDVLARLPADTAHATERPVAVRQGSLLATAFHPELTDDDRFHRHFLDIVRQQGRKSTPR